LILVVDTYCIVIDDASVLLLCDIFTDSRWLLGYQTTFIHRLHIQEWVVAEFLRTCSCAADTLIIMQNIGYRVVLLVNVHEETIYFAGLIENNLCTMTFSLSNIIYLDIIYVDSCSRYLLYRY
jgi:hypothetical protein